MSSKSPSPVLDSFVSCLRTEMKQTSVTRDTHHINIPKKETADLKDDIMSHLKENFGMMQAETMLDLIAKHFSVYMKRLGFAKRNGIKLGLKGMGCNPTTKEGRAWWLYGMGCDDEVEPVILPSGVSFEPRGEFKLYFQNFKDCLSEQLATGKSKKKKGRKTKKGRKGKGKSKGKKGKTTRNTRKRITHKKNISRKRRMTRKKRLVRNYGGMEPGNEGVPPESEAAGRGGGGDADMLFGERGPVDTSGIAVREQLELAYDSSMEPPDETSLISIYSHIKGDETEISVEAANGRPVRAVTSSNFLIRFLGLPNYLREIQFGNSIYILENMSIYQKGSPPVYYMIVQNAGQLKYRDSDLRDKSVEQLRRMCEDEASIEEDDIDDADEAEDSKQAFSELLLGVREVGDRSIEAVKVSDMLPILFQGEESVLRFEM